MGRPPNKLKQNPKLTQREMTDGRASLILEYYLGSTRSPVYDDDGNHVLYEKGAMKGKPKYKTIHEQERVAESLHLDYSTHSAGTSAEQEHAPTRREDTV